jgi:hypothetical protein
MNDRADNPVDAVSSRRNTTQNARAVADATRGVYTFLLVRDR